MLGNPNAKQKKFHSWVRRRGCVIDKSEHPALHHIGGSKMKLKGVDKAGEWLVIGLSYFWHQDGCNPAAVHINKSEFIQVNCMTEKDMWIEQMAGYKAEKGEYPMPEHEYQIIVDRG